MRKPPISFACVLAGALVSACATTQERSAQEENAARIVASNCVTTQTVGSYKRPNQKIDTSSVYVASITKGEKDWVRINAVIRGISGNIYYDLSSRKVVCGSENWENLGLVFHVAPGKVDLSE